MKITTRAKVMTGAIALAGVATLTGGAFTATGVDNQAGASQFVGGQVSQTVTGATLSKVQYEFTDASNTAVDGVTLAFAEGADGRAVSVTLTHAGTPTTTAIDCGVVEATSNSATCTVDAVTFPDGITGVSNIDVVVNSENVA